MVVSPHLGFLVGFFLLLVFLYQGHHKKLPALVDGGAPFCTEGSWVTSTLCCQDICLQVLFVLAKGKIFPIYEDAEAKRNFDITQCAQLDSMHDPNSKSGARCCKSCPI